MASRSADEALLSYELKPTAACQSALNREHFSRRFDRLLATGYPRARCRCGKPTYNVRTSSVREYSRRQMLRPEHGERPQRVPEPGRVVGICLLAESPGLRPHSDSSPCGTIVSETHMSPRDPDMRSRQLRAGSRQDFRRSLAFSWLALAVDIA